jgi:hypothetical protein
MGIEIKLITADEAYNDKDGSLLADTGVHLIIPVSKSTVLPDDVEPETLAVTCDDLCEIPMIRFGLTEDGHKYKCNASPDMCSRSGQYQQFRIIPYDNGHFQRMPVDSDLAKI